MCTGPFPGEKRQRLDVNNPPPSSAVVKERVQIYSTTDPLCLHSVLYGEVYFYVYPKTVDSTNFQYYPYFR